MERTQIFDLMGELKLYGMKAAFDEIMATAVKRQHEPQHIVGDLLSAEINEKQARSIKYQLTRRLSMISPAAASSPSNATSSWSAERAPARPIWPLLSREAASDPVLVAASIMWSTSSTASRPRPATGDRAGLPST
jgi:hypothetical protein